jgi:hypothetical protein
VAKAGFRQALLLTLVLWLVVGYGGHVVSELIAGRTGFLRTAPLDLAALLLVALVAQTLYPLAVRTAEWPLSRRWTTIAAATVLVALVQSLIT